MEIYKNDYTEKEDKVLWEIHEIRHTLTKEYEKMTSNEINLRAKKIYNDFLKKRKLVHA